MVCQVAVQQQTLPEKLKTFCEKILGGDRLCTGEMLHKIPLDGAVVPLEHPHMQSCRSICCPKAAMNSYVLCSAADGGGLGIFFA